jgi:hypothetical protein
MLDLDDTSLLLDGLRPPPGYEFDAAIGTTFTLNLVTLLAVPVTATMAQNADEAAEVLEAIRRYADRTILYCQAGAISIPSSYRPALTLVENSVVEVKKPDGGLFHPKVWVVRFSRRGRDYLHRVLVMSRNLTFDRALDVVARFDEGDESMPRLDTSGVVELLRSLDRPAGLARPMTKSQRTLLTDVARTLSHAHLAVPAPFTEGSTISLMPGGRDRFYHDKCDHAFAVSPFLTGGAARHFLSTGTSWSGVASRRAALDSSAGSLGKVDCVLRIRDSLVAVQQSIDELDDPDNPGDKGSDASPSHRGLHAKIWVQDCGKSSTVWLGSANLTDAALTVNHELMVRLGGPSRVVGIDSLIDFEHPKNNLASIVEEHEFATDVAEEEEDPDGVSEIEHLAYLIASSKVVLKILHDGEKYTAALSVQARAVPAGVAVEANLLTLRPKDTQELVNGHAEWGSLASQDITPFVVVTVRTERATPIKVMVRAQLSGDPADRRTDVIARAIQTRDDFFRYLAALLGWSLTPGASADGDGEWMGGGWLAGEGGERLLEDMVTTAARAPDRFESLEATLARIETDPKLAKLVPDDFRHLWDAVRTATKVRR